MTIAAAAATPHNEFVPTTPTGHNRNDRTTVPTPHQRSIFHPASLPNTVTASSVSSNTISSSGNGNSNSSTMATASSCARKRRSTSSISWWLQSSYRFTSSSAAAATTTTTNNINNNSKMTHHIIPITSMTPHTYGPSSATTVSLHNTHRIHRTAYRVVLCTVFLVLVVFQFQSGQMTIAKLTHSIILPASSSLNNGDANILDDFLWEKDSATSRSRSSVRDTNSDTTGSGSTTGGNSNANVDRNDDDAATIISRRTIVQTTGTDEHGVSSEDNHSDRVDIEEEEEEADDGQSDDDTATIGQTQQSQVATTTAASIVYKRPTEWKLFPRWNNSAGIPIQPLMDFIYGVANETASTIETSTIRSIFPETLYVFDVTGVYYSHSIRKRTKPTFINDRVKPTEKIMKLAHQILMAHVKGLQTLQQDYKSQFNDMAYVLRGLNNYNTTDSTTGTTPAQSHLILRHKIQKMEKKWKRLQAMILEKGSFPFLAWFGDFTSCNYRNWKRPIRSHDIPTTATNRLTAATVNVALDNLNAVSWNREDQSHTYESIPLFTTCAQVRCHHAFPLPTYKTIQGSLESTFKWKKRMQDYHDEYPVELDDKIPKLVWRGSLTGDIQNYTNVRWLLCKYVTNAPADEKEYYDIGLTKIPPRHDKVPLNLTIVGDLVSGIFPMAAFQNYRAILDIDGNSWSSRFGSLLCYHSVVLKVEPMYVDYFHYTSLIPNVHYVPVHYNLSNLYSQTRYVMDPNNREDVQRIIYNANAWCQINMVYSKIANDYLTIFDEYVGYLNVASTATSVDWNAIWKQEKNHRVFSNTGPFNMVPIK